ncbi:MAG: RAMP superfamily CRISPR-associated protein [Hominimerdicola sp.]
MIKNYRISCTLRSPLHINDGVSTDKIRLTIKREGQPYIPSTLLKGCVRQQFEKLLDLCGLDKNISDTIFGSEGFNLSRVIFDNLMPKSKAAFEYRTNNKSNRYLRKAEDKQLVTSETVSPYDEENKPLVFAGEMNLYLAENNKFNYDKLEKLLIKAIESVDNIGSSKSRGWGFVDMKVSPLERKEQSTLAQNISGRRKIAFTLESDVITGGITITNNFKETTPYLTGSVVRAAFAKDIFLTCPFADKPTDDGKYNYIELKNEGCESCAKKEICEKFSDMSFSFFYPENCIPAPLTAKKCKTYGTEHPIQDSLVKTPKKCYDGNCNLNGKGRLENLKGFIDSDNKSYKIKTVTTTHTAINYMTNSNLDGSLYSVCAIKSGQTFTGYIDDCASGLLYDGKIIYVGKYSSNGFGKIKITVSDEDEKTNFADNINAFNNKFKGTDIFKQNPDKIFVPILFLSDAKLGFENYDGKILSTADYEIQWHKAIFDNNNLFKIEQIFAQNYVYRGFDTSKGRISEDKDRIKKPVILTKMGTTILISFDKSNKEKALDFLAKLVKTGVGEDTKNGFGQIEICNRIHMRGITHD